MEINIDKPRLLVVSHVLPVFTKSGQQQRVYSILKALKEFFNITFLTVVDTKDAQNTKERLSSLCDEVILLTSRYSQSKITKIWHRIVGTFYCLTTGLKLSNYILGKLEFTTNRISSLLKNRNFDCVLFEYWHAFRNVDFFRRKNALCILDMHDIQWQTYKQYLSSNKILKLFKRYFLAKYKNKEESAWRKFDGIIAINNKENEYIKRILPSHIKIFYLPMGVDTNYFTYSWEPAYPIRIGYYGGIGNRINQKGVLECYKNIMPLIWKIYPEVEFWIVGSNPSSLIFSLTKDARAKVTGFVEDVRSILKSLFLIICPWFGGTYGFRSRFIEAMALGVPIVTTKDAIYGMDLDINNGIFVANSTYEIAKICLNLINNPDLAKQKSYQAYLQVKTKFNFDITYNKFAKELYKWVYDKNISEKT